MLIQEIYVHVKTATFEEFLKTTEEMKTYKAAGPDEITTDLMKLL